MVFQMALQEDILCCIQFDDLQWDDPHPWIATTSQWRLILWDILQWDNLQK